MMAMMKFVVMRCTFGVLLGVLTCGSCFAQRMPVGAGLQSGTLNLLLANRRGFVIAADSRRTQLSDGKYWDDSQKLFRVGPNSALVIAGFASWAAQGSPLDFQIASFFREEFADRVWSSGQRPLTGLPRMVNADVGDQLQLFGAIGATNRPAPPPENLDFQVLAAGLSADKVQIIRIHFTPRVQLLGPFDLAMPFYDMQSSTTTVDSFVALSGGIDQLARTILDGNLGTRDERILNYYRARDANKLNDLSLESLQDLATAILEETGRFSQYVGGPNQIGVFPKKGRVKWLLPKLATDRAQLRSTFLNVGFMYTSGGLTPREYSLAHGKKMITNFGLSLLQPFEVPFTQVFVGNWFRGVAVSLDGNAFVGNHFENVTFRYRGGNVFVPAGNDIAGCMLEMTLAVKIPSPLRACHIRVLDSVEIAGAVGSPIRAAPKGCVTRNRDGRLVLKTKGRQKGKDCKGSKVEVLFQPLGPGADVRH